MITDNPEIYPRTRQQLVHAGLAVIGLLLVLLVGLAAVRHSSDRQVLSRADLKQMSEELQSYDAEAEVVLRQYLSGRATEAYTMAYTDTLRESVDSLNQDLQSHSAEPAARGPADRIASQAGLISSYLRKVGSATDTAGLRDVPAALHSSGQQLQDIGDKL